MVGLTEDAIESRPCRYGMMSFFKNDTIISRSLNDYGEWAQAEIEFLLGLIRPEDTILDVGAFIGTHTLAFAKHVGGGKVYAFEAQPAFFEVLKKNVEQNRLTNVSLLDVALSDDVKRLQIEDIDLRDALNFGATSILEPRPTAGVVARHFIKATTVDQLAINRCDLIKIDAENMEMPVLKGARRTLHATSPVVYAECNSLQYGWPVVEFMKGEGYASYLLNVQAYNPHNFRQNPGNFFGSARETGLILFPMERVSRLRDELRRHPALIPIARLDDLALGLLKKPQYKYEVMANTEAASIIGIDFWANEPETAQFRNQAKALQNETLQMQEKIAFLEDKLATVVQKDWQLAEVLAELKQSTDEAARLKAIAERQRYELQSIYTSFGWKLLTGYRCIKDGLLPPRTSRRKLYDWIIVALKGCAKKSA